MWIYLFLIFNLIRSFDSRLCCDQDFRIEKEYCEPFASVFEFEVLDSRIKSDLIEYDVEVIRIFRGHFQIHTRSLLVVAKHYCLPEIKLYHGRHYIAITKSLNVRSFTIDNCFFEQIQFTHQKIEDNHLLCLPFDINSSFRTNFMPFHLLIVMQIFLIYVSSILRSF